MAEIPSFSPPSKSDTSTMFADALQSVGWGIESDVAAKQAKLAALLPKLSGSSLDAVISSLNGSGLFDAFVMVLDGTPEEQRDARIGKLLQQELSRGSSSINSLLASFVDDHSVKDADTKSDRLNAFSEAQRVESWTDQWAERLRDVQAFDSLLAKHPEIATRLRAKGIDIDGEKQREVSKLKAENPGISNEEAVVRSSLAVYLRHESAIREAAPDYGARYALDTALDGLKRSARDIGMPYQESVKAARDISSFDKASILQATSVTSFDTRGTRTNNELRFDNPGERFSQVWTLRPGARPEKALELPNGPRIKIATAPEPDAALNMKRTKAMDEIANLTGWEWVRSSDGLDLARKHFPQSLSASLHEALSAPDAWRAFVLSFADATAENRRNLIGMMRERNAAITDPKLRSRMDDALNDLAGSEKELGDSAPELLSKLGDRYGRMIDQEAGEVRQKAEKRSKAFGLALNAIDEVDTAETKTAQEFQREVDWVEAIARDNLSYFADNGYSVFGPNLWEFLSVLNKNRASIYPQSEANIELPKVLTEKDRALMAHGLVRVIGGDRNVDDYFEVPGYKLKRFDVTGVRMLDQIKLDLLESSTLVGGEIRLSAIELKMQSKVGT